MFCEKTWFRRACGSRIVPNCWQGWVCVGGWAAGTVLPLWLLLARGQPLEAAVWLILAIGGMCSEVRQLHRALREEVTMALGRTPSVSNR